MKELYCGDLLDMVNRMKGTCVKGKRGKEIVASGVNREGGVT